MDDYTNQSYFKALCEVSSVAYDELKKMRAATGKNFSTRISENDEDTIEWLIRLVDSSANVVATILKAVEKKKTFVINTREEVLALINFYSNHHINSYRVINESREFEQILPDDELTSRFMEAYRNGDNDEMVKIFKSTYEAEI